MNRIYKFYFLLFIYIHIIANSSLAIDPLKLIKTLEGYQKEDYFGLYTSKAGDLNGDGYDDFIVSAPFNDKAYDAAGCVYVFFGGNTISDKPGLVIYGSKPGESIGYHISYAGDFNADGYSDILIGSKLYFGGKNMDKIEDIDFKSGYTSSYAGDFNNDGYDDIVVGNIYDSTYGFLSGCASVYFGGPNYDTIPDLTLYGGIKGIEFGSKFSYVGDMNGDGISDIAVGAPRFNYDSLVGKVYIYFGSNLPKNKADVVLTGKRNHALLGNCLQAVGDVNNDGYDDLLISSPYDGSWIDTSFVNIYYGGNPMDTLADIIICKMQHDFGMGLSSAGDINNDGFDDILVGGLGNVRAYFGGNKMDTISDYTISGTNYWNQIGSSISYIGDINHDGYHEYLINQPYYEKDSTIIGRVFIYSSTTKTLSIKDLNKNINARFFPNPFTQKATIEFNLIKPGYVSVVFYNQLGEVVEIQNKSYRSTGMNKISWEPKELSAGIYFCKISTPENTYIQRLVLQK